MASVTIQRQPGEPAVSVVVEGDVDDDTDLGVLESLSGPVELNLAGARRFNSGGVRVWVEALCRLAATGPITCVECSVAVIRQLNMIGTFLGHATVRSFYAPMCCERCDFEGNHLCLADEIRQAGTIAPPPCPCCGACMALDEPEVRYLLFLREPTPARG